MSYLRDSFESKVSSLEFEVGRKDDPYLNHPAQIGVLSCLWGHLRKKLIAYKLKTRDKRPQAFESSSLRTPNYFRLILNTGCISQLQPSVCLLPGRPRLLPS